MKDITPVGSYGADANDTGLIWSTIIGGALTSIVVSLVLFPVAGALGFSSLSPWDDAATGMGKTFAISGAIALIAIQWIASAFGGYLTGRMRTKWAGAHTHEVFFRDTVHGFLAWALATVLVGVLFVAGAGHMHHHGMDHGRYALAGHETSSPASYFVDRLFRSTQKTTLSDDDRMYAERIFESASTDGNVSSDDKNYLTQLVSARTGVSNADAEMRVENTLAEEKMAVKNLKKYTALSSIFILFAMVMGAFISGVAGGLGGQHRDLHYVNGRLTE